MEGLIVPSIFFVIVLLLYAYLMYQISTMKTDLKYLEKEIIIKLTFLNTLHTGLQTEVIEFKEREQALNKELYKFLLSVEDRFEDPVEDIDFHVLLETLRRETV